MKKYLLPFFLVLFLISCKNDAIVDKNNEGKIKILNFGSIHLSGSTDAYSSITNINDPKVKKEIKLIVDQLVAFKPTIICVEIPPESTDFINETFQKYKTDQSNRINYSEEVNVIGLEVARLSNTKKIYGIDNPIGFDYPSLVSLANKQITDSLYVQKVMKRYDEVNKKPILEQFKEVNSHEYKMETFDFYNFLATMHTKDNFEGADIISEFYKRNLRMFTNFSDIPLTKEDRVLILMGATHTAYFDIFIGNSPKYSLENPEKYTNYKNH